MKTDTTQEKQFAAGLFRARVMWSLTAACIPVYFIVCVSIRVAHEEFGGYVVLAPSIYALVKYVFLGAALVTGVVLTYILGQSRFITSGAKSLEEFLRLFLSRTLILTALAEVPATLGLVLFFLNGQLRDAGLFMIFGAVCSAIGAYPTEDRVNRLARALREQPQK